MRKSGFVVLIIAGNFEYRSSIQIKMEELRIGWNHVEMNNTLIRKDCTYLDFPEQLPDP